jgi:type II secretion system protein G
MEVLVVMAILVVLASMATFSILSVRRNALINTAQITCTTIRDQVKAYYIKVGYMPTSIDDLVQNNTGTDNWGGPYFENGQAPIDPWGNRFELQSQSDPTTGQEQVQVVSFGPDGVQGSGDDIILTTSL